ncbi:hypothetical protein LTR81_028192, partial [Elasticomyces elasticus]
MITTIPHLVRQECGLRKEFEKQHLFTRAWVLQEQLLSNRLLHVGSIQLYWQCQTSGLQCEGLPGIEAPHCKVNPLGLGEELQIRSAHDDTRLLLLHDYQNRNLTYAVKDKLRAIQGVGDGVARMRGTTYTSGVFLDELPLTLLWKATRFGVNSSAVPYQAPTWSWASMRGDLDFRYGEKLSKLTDPSRVETLVSSLSTRDWACGCDLYQALALTGRTIYVPTNTQLNVENRRLKFTKLGLAFECTIDDVSEMDFDERYLLFILPLAH